MCWSFWSSLSRAAAVLRLVQRRRGSPRGGFGRIWRSFSARMSSSASLIFCASSGFDREAVGTLWLGGRCLLPGLWPNWVDVVFRRC